MQSGNPEPTNAIVGRRVGGRQYPNPSILDGLR